MLFAQSSYIFLKTDFMKKEIAKISLPSWKIYLFQALRVVLQSFAIPCYFPYIIFCHYILSLLSLGWFVIAVCGSVSVRKLVK